jgi:nitroimidazol reductase NimA-like FMN-containing flavoprotein (pyridoxamine 5'-phosphate oxidase superfamily)
MEGDDAVTLTADERDAFLGNGGTGVVALATDAGDPPNAVPVSYGYDAESGQFFFRLAFTPEGERAEVLADQHPASFVTYDEGEGDRWRSVVANGTLEAIPEDADTEVLDALDRVHIPHVSIFERDERRLSFRFYRLRPESVTGRREDPVVE